MQCTDRQGVGVETMSGLGIKMTYTVIDAGGQSIKSSGPVEMKFARLAPAPTDDELKSINVTADIVSVSVVECPALVSACPRGYFHLEIPATVSSALDANRYSEAKILRALGILLMKQPPFLRAFGTDSPAKATEWSLFRSGEMGDIGYVPGTGKQRCRYRVGIGHSVCPTAKALGMPSQARTSLAAYQPATPSTKSPDALLPPASPAEKKPTGGTHKKRDKAIRGVEKKEKKKE